MVVTDARSVGGLTVDSRNGSHPGVCRPRVTATALGDQRLKFLDGLRFGLGGSDASGEKRGNF